MADLILADFKSKTWVSDRQRQEADLKQQAREILKFALVGGPVMPPVDTACSEMSPDRDGAA